MKTFNGNNNTNNTSKIEEVISDLEKYKIDSEKNKTYKDLVNISKGKSEDNLVLIEGVDLVNEAFNTNRLRKVVFVDNCQVLSESDVLDSKLVDEIVSSEIETVLLSKKLVRNITSFQSLPKVIGIASLNVIKIDENWITNFEKNNIELSKVLGNKLVYLDNLQDGGNVGTLIRSALCFNFDSVITSFDSIQLTNRKVVQASKGAIFKLKLFQADLKFLSKYYPVLLTTLDGEEVDEKTKLDTSKLCLVLGNEGHGIRTEYLDLGRKLKLKINNIDSLNVAIAGSIFMYLLK